MSDAIDESRLCATWSLKAATARDSQGRHLPQPYGPEPMGRLVLSRTGRMMAVLCDGRTALPPNVARAYASYCGNYRVEGDRLITRVDAALIPERVGGDQVRRFELRGDTLVLYPPMTAEGVQREIVWERNGPA